MIFHRNPLWHLPSLCRWHATTGIWQLACGVQRRLQLRGIRLQLLRTWFFAWPGQFHTILRMARQHMQVKVEDRLPARCTVGLKECQPVGCQRLLRSPGDALRRLHDGGGFLRRQIQHGHRVAFAGHQHVAGVDLTNVHKSQRQIVFIHLGGGYLACDDLAEDAVPGGRGVNKHGHGGGVSVDGVGIIVGAAARLCQSG